MLLNILHTEPPAPRTLRPEVPAALEAICLRAMGKRPADRYPGCRELADALRAWLRQPAAPARVRQPAPTDPGPRRAFPWVPVAVGGTIALAACLVVSIILLLPSPPSQDSDQQAKTEKKPGDDRGRRGAGEAGKGKKVMLPGDPQAKADKAAGAKTDAGKQDGAKAGALTVEVKAANPPRPRDGGKKELSQSKGGKLQEKTSPSLAEQAAKLYAPPGVGCSVMMPRGDVKQIQQDYPLPRGGTAKLQMYHLQRGLVKYGLVVTDIPPSEASGEQLLAGASAQFMAQLKGAKVIADKKITVDGHPGLDLTVEVPSAGLIRVWTAVAGQRVYVAFVMGDKDFATSAEADRYLQSFKIQPPTGPPSDRVVEVGRFDVPEPGAPLVPVLLQYAADNRGKEQWRRLERPRALRVVTGRPLVSLPGYRSVVVTDSGVRLTLDGTMPEYFPGTPLLFESLVELHQHKALDLDLTLRRGRIRLANAHADRPVRVRVRFENTTNPESKETWDITLEEKDAEVLIDCFGFFPPDERFHEDHKSRDRAGPITQVGLTVLAGSVHLRMDKVTHVMKAPPGPARMVWNSEKGARGPLPVRQLEEWTQPDPPVPKVVSETVEVLRKELQRQARQLSLDLFGAPELGIIKSLNSVEPARRKLAVRACGALDMLPRMVDALTDKDRPDVRQSAIETLSHWIASGRDNEYLLFDYLVFDALNARYTRVEAEKIVTLLRGPPGKGRFQPQTYETLIDMLASPRLPIRDLAAWQLFQIVPRARELRPDPMAPPERMQAQWRQLVPRGTIPAEYKKMQLQDLQ